MSAEALKNVNTNKFIPLFRRGDDIPYFLLGRDYVDMRDETMFDKNYNELIRDIWNEPENKKPLLGAKPNFD